MSEPAEIWIVRGRTDYEGDDIVSAHEDENEARAEARRLSELLKARPSDDHFDSTSSEEEWCAHEKETREWVAKFPFSGLSACDEFDVISIPFFRKEVKP